MARGSRWRYGSNALALSSASVIAITSYLSSFEEAGAQTVINNGDNSTVAGAADNETITAAAGVTSTVDGAPVILINNDNVTVENAGTLRTTGVTQTIQVNVAAQGGTINNAQTGSLEAASRVIDIRNSGLTVNNSGEIIGTGNQRNGTLYADGTADDFTVNNAASGTIDAGEGNTGSGVGVEIGGTEDGANTFTLVNDGTIQGRGNAPAGENAAGDGIRVGNVGNIGTAEASITNTGLIDSEGANGTVAGVRFVNGVSFDGTLDNSGTISGTQNGVYFGNAVNGEGADHSNGVVNNLEGGVISSDSRAFNVDGTGLTVNNSGEIIGTGNQRNGTLYADGTADDFTVNNAASGTIDAGEGNQGSGISLQLGVADGDTRTLIIDNAGLIAGRGGALDSGESAGLRFFNGAGEGTNVTVNGSVENSGSITSETSAAILVEGVAVTPTIVNSGLLSGTLSVDASTATAGINVENRAGVLDGDFVGSNFDDTLAFTGGVSTLTDDVLNDVDVSVAADSTLVVDGERSIDGTFTQTGTSVFDLGEGVLTVSGDANLAPGSTVIVNTPTELTGLAFDEAIPVIIEGSADGALGTLEANNNATVLVEDNSFLVDFDVTADAVTVTPIVADLDGVSDDPNILSLSGAVQEALAAEALPAPVLVALDASANDAEFEAGASTLLPSLNAGVTREIFETQQVATRELDKLREGRKRGVWGRIFGRTAQLDRQSESVAGFDSNAFGIAVGGAVPVTETLSAGANVIYTNISIDNDGVGNQQSDVDAFRLAGTLDYRSGPLFASTEIGYTYGSVDTSRNSVAGTISGDFDVQGFSARAAAGYDLSVGPATTLTPEVGLRYARFSADDFTESGGLNLSVQQDDAEFLEGVIGVTARTKVQLGAASITPFVRGAYVYDFSSSNQGLTASFDGASPFSLNADEQSESRFEIGLGFDANVSETVSVGIGYEGEFASDYDAHAGVLRVAVKF